MNRRLWFHRDDEFKAWICLELAAKVPALADDKEFLHSILAIVSSGAYTAFRSDVVTADGSRTRYAGGLVGAYNLPFSEENVMGVEAVWFADDDHEAHSFVWQMLLKEARDAGFSSLCVMPATATHVPRHPLQEHEWNEFGVVRNTHTLMRAFQNSVWSAFLGADLSGPARFVDCLRIVPQVRIDLRGKPYLADALLFRGEGRVGRGPYADCATLEEVAKKAFRDGFSARGQGRFAGTIPEQIKHQGYVPSSTVSLTGSSQVAAYYATQAGALERALVFLIDPEALRTSGPVWDSLTSMTHATPIGWLESDFDLVVRLVGGLGSLYRAGSVLEQMASGMSRFAQEAGPASGLTSEQYRLYVGEDAWSAAATVLTEHEISQVCSVLEYFLGWHESPEGIVVSGPYAAAFVVSREELRDVMRSSNNEWQHPGWDTTVFGYLAKTCRDREFFSTGPISGAAVREAWVVDKHGGRIAVLNR